jgi:hypothetical protein
MMEISENTIVELVRTTSQTAQSLEDLKNRMDRDVPLLVATSKVITDRFDTIEEDLIGVKKKLWYFGGAGTVLGYIGSHFFEKWFNLGGK